MERVHAVAYRPRSITIFALVVATLSLLFWSWHSVRADDKRSTTGIVETMPKSGVIGDWTISGVGYRTNAGSEIRADKGPMVAGACVEVESTGAREPYMVRKLKTKNSDDCDSQPSLTPDVTETPESTASVTPDMTGTPAATVTPDMTVTPEATTTAQPTSTDDGDNDAEGIVEKMPERGLLGIWTIDGVEYDVTAKTRIRQKDGPLMVGACVEVRFDRSTTPFTATRIETEEMDECDKDGEPTPEATTTPGTSTLPPAAFFDRIDHIPDGLIGNWIFEGVTYIATNDTRFQPKRGPFEIEACAKVIPFNEPMPRRIRKLETAHDFLCDKGEDGSAESELFGILQAFPMDLIGDWQIGGKTFVADENTSFKQEDGEFARGITVKVHFTEDGSGVRLAREIETVFENDDDGEDDDGNGVHEGASGHAFGLIEDFPADLLGTWTVSGIDYTARIETIFEQENGVFAIDARVKVEYYIDANGNRVAQQIKTTNEDGEPEDNSHFKLYGFVDQMPPDGFVGQWIVDNIAFMSDGSSRFEEDHGLLGIGSFVEVEYYFKDGRNQIYKLESHVPPGGGDKTEVGTVDSTGGGLVAASTAARTWIIGGQSYVVTAATDFNEVKGALIVGSTAAVNSYAAPDGSQVATQIRSVTFSNQVMLPLIAR